MSIVADRWSLALQQLGFDVYTVAGEGPVDHLVPGLAIDAAEPPDRSDIAAALQSADLVVVENLCTIPLNLEASRAVAGCLAGRPAIMHHHDPPWQRARFRHIDELPIDDPAWRHVTINEMTRRAMRARGFDATTIYNPFVTDELLGDRVAARAALGIGPDDLLAAHPVRAIERKNIPLAIELAEALGATYWLLGPAEEGYGAELGALLAGARPPVIHRGCAHMANAYAACDVVLFPSTWEGFGNPPIEAAIHRRPVVVGDYPVSHELEAMGFRWFRPETVDELLHFLDDPDPQLLDDNQQLAARRFSIESTRRLLADLISEAGWS